MTVPLHPEAPKPVVRVWSPLAVAVFSFFMTYPAGLLLAMRNWRALGLHGRAGPHIGAAVLLTFVLVGIYALSPARRVRRILVLVTQGVVFVYLKERLRSDHEEFAAAHPDVRVETRPWYSGFGWALLGMVSFFAMLLPPALVIALLLFDG